MKASPACCPWLPFSLGKFTRGLGVAYLFLIIGCGSQPGPMTGNWGLSLVTLGTLNQVVAALNLQQSGNTVSGTITSSLCSSKTTVNGGLNGTSLVLALVTPNASGTLTGTVNNSFSSVSGTYSVAGNWCAQSSGPGTWTAVFLSN